MDGRDPRQQHGQDPRSMHPATGALQRGRPSELAPVTRGGFDDDRAAQQAQMQQMQAMQQAQRQQQMQPMQQRQDPRQLQHPPQQQGQQQQMQQQQLEMQRMQLQQREQEMAQLQQLQGQQQQQLQQMQGGGGNASQRGDSQWGSQQSMQTVQSGRSDAPSEGGSRRESSAVRQAVRSAAAQVEQLQRESTARGRSSNTPEPMGSRRPNVETLPPARPQTSAGLVNDGSQLELRPGMGPRSQEMQQSGEKSKTWMWSQQSPPAMLKELNSVRDFNMKDDNGWTCLHWAALRGATDHVVALLDSGADSMIATTQSVSMAQTCGDRPSGTTPEHLARNPAQGVAAHTKIIKMLMGAEQGHWNRRRDLKRNGDAAMSRHEYARAVDCYIDSRKAVPVAEAYDSPVLQLISSLREAKSKAAEEADKASAPVEHPASSGSSYGGGGGGSGARAELAPGGLRARSTPDPYGGGGGGYGGSQLGHGSSFMSDTHSVHSSAAPSNFGATELKSSNAAVSNAVREAENKNRAGDIQGTLTSIEDAIAYGFQSAEAMQLKLLMRKVSTHLMDEAMTSKSEAEAAKDYAKGRDAEVYDLAVGKKRIEDESVSERQKLADEMVRAKRDNDQLAETLQRAAQEKTKAVDDLEQMRSMVENQRGGWEAEKRSLEYDRNSMEAGTQKLSSQLVEVQATNEEQKAEVEKLTEKLRCTERDKLVKEKEVKDLATEVEKAEKKIESKQEGQQEALAQAEDTRKEAQQQVEELEAQIRRLTDDVSAAQQHAQAEASRADQGWEKAKEAAGKVDAEVSRARDAENQMALMERELDQIQPRVAAAEERAARAETRIDKEMERADKESEKAEKAREALSQQQNESQNDAHRLKDLSAMQEQLERVQGELAITKEDLKQSEANAIINLKQAQDVAVHHSRQFEEAAQLLTLLELDLSDIDTDRIDVIKAAEKRVPSLERELAENIEAWQIEVKEKDAVLQEFAETSAVEISKRDVELERQIADHAKQTAELRSELDEARMAADEHVQASETKHVELEKQQEEAQLQLESASEQYEVQVAELNLTIDRMQDRNQSLLDDSKALAAQSESTLEKHKEAQRSQVEKLTGTITSKDSEIKEIKKKVKTLAKNLQEQARESEDVAQKSTKHLNEVKAKFEEEHKKWVQTLTDERASFQKTLSNTRAKVSQEMTQKLNAERDSRAVEADHIRQEHAKLAANLSRKMEEAVGDARSTMEAVSRAASVQSSPLRQPNRTPASAAKSSPGYGGESAVSEEQMVRLHAVWQDKMDVQGALMDEKIEAGEEERAQLMERIAASTNELKEVQAQLLSTRQRLVEEGHAAEKSEAASTDAADKVSQLQLEVDSMRAAATTAEELYDTQIADQGGALRAQIGASVAQIKSLKIEIDQMAASLDEAQGEVLAAREDQFAAKLKVQEMERQLRDTSGLVAVQADLERAHSEVITLTRELTSVKSMAEEARMESKAAAAAVTQREAKIAALERAAEESDSLREQLRAEQTTQQATQQAKQLAAKNQQIEALKEAASVADQALVIAHEQEDTLKREQVANSRRYQELEGTLAGRALREEQLNAMVAARETLLEEKTQELQELVASTEDETAGAQATAEIMEAELAAATEARDRAMESVSVSERASSGELVKAEEKIVDLEARLQVEIANVEAEALRAAAVEMEKQQLDMLMKTIVKRFENQAAEAIEMTETFTPASPARFDSGDPAAPKDDEAGWAPLQDIGNAFDDMPAGADAATLQMPVLPTTPPSGSRRRSFASVSSVGSVEDDRAEDVQETAESPARASPVRRCASPVRTSPVREIQMSGVTDSGSDEPMASPTTRDEMRDTFESHHHEEPAPAVAAPVQTEQSPTKRVPSAVEAFIAAEAETTFSSPGSGEPRPGSSSASVISEEPSQPPTSRSHDAFSAPVSAPMTPHASPPQVNVPPINLQAVKVASTEPKKMPKRGRQALKQEQVEQIAAALGLPPHKLTDELLEKPSVLALIDSSAGNVAQLAEANPSSPEDPSRVAGRVKVAANVAMAVTKKGQNDDFEEGDRRRPARGRGRRAPRR